MTKEERCIHRHTRKEHPRCFVNGLIKTQVVREQKLPVKILLLDIETSPLQVLCWGLWDQNISTDAIIQDWHLLSWSAKWLFDPTTQSDVLTSKEAKAHDDFRVVASMWDYLDQADIVITHNGNSFDLKRMNTRFIKHNLMLPSAFQSIDTLKVAKDQFNFTSNKLDYINQFLGLEMKQEVGFETWKKCFEGDEEALKKLESYNRNDVDILEDTYLRMRPYIKGHPNLNLWSVENTSICPNCGSKSLEWKGNYFTYTGRYSSFRCNECNAIGRARLTNLDKEKRKVIVR